jgi:tetratricopeptide (TPR) repeat protein
METSLPTQNTFLLRKGIAAARAGRAQEARRLLQQIVALDPDNEMAWLWLSGLVATNQEKMNCLERVLRSNPHNAYARAGLDRLRSASPPPSASKEQDELEARLASVSGSGGSKDSDSDKSPGDTGRSGAPEDASDANSRAAKPTIKRLSSLQSPTNGAGKPARRSQPDPQESRPQDRPPEPEDPMQTTCPACEGPLRVTASICPHCYLHFQPLDEPGDRQSPASDAGPKAESSPEQPAQRRGRSLRDLFNLLSLF